MDTAPDISLVDVTATDDLAVLDRIQQRVLWLATSMIHHANKERTTASGLKVGGHQASSASAVTILTALYLAHLSADDVVSVKPHASPVLHAINYLLGRLDARYLTELRAFGGLQSYPSRTKDPDPIDFSTGSVGIGATASVWSALSRRYLADHFATAPPGRHVSLVGDAELDEGAVWEALGDPSVAQMGELLWIIDLNRQSLDRIVPDIAANRLRAMFAAAGWQTITVKYGSRLRELFRRKGGEALRQRLDLMSNEEYQHLLRTPADQLRAVITGSGRFASDIRQLMGHLDDATIETSLRDLGGHNLGDLLHAFSEADRKPCQPTVVIAYTIKAWRLPTQGHPGNHSSLLSSDQWLQLGHDLGADPEHPWKAFPAGSAEALACSAAARRLLRPDHGSSRPPRIPLDLNLRYRGTESTQAALGRLLVDLRRSAPDAAARIVTVSPDVATSTNLGGWINKVGVWNIRDRPDWFADDHSSSLRWREIQRGQHIELGIAEVNLAGLLAELGSTWSRTGEPLLPIGTIYDPFIARALEPWSFGIYSGGQSILVGTPSGITLAPEGGAHQSLTTPSIGLEQPGCVAWEPAFGQDLEWTLLSALGRLGQTDGTSSYFRLSTRPIDQSISETPADGEAREQRRHDVLQGGYPIRQCAGAPVVTLVGMGAVMPEVLAAASNLTDSGINCDVICLTSADLIFRALQARRGLLQGSAEILTRLFPAGRAAPIVSVLDGHPHTLAFLSAVGATPITCLGVSSFGQSGDIGDLYRHYSLDGPTIVGAAWDLIDEFVS